MAQNELIAKLPSPQNARLYIAPKDIFSLITEFVHAPDLAWKRVLANSEKWPALFERYVFFLAAVPVVSRFFGQVLFAGAPIINSLMFAIIGYLCSLGFLFAATFIAHRSVAIFDGKLSMDDAAKLVVYSFVPFFVSGIFFLLPPLSILTVVGFYSFYLFYTGIQSVAGIPKQKLMAYFMMNVVSWMVISGFLMDAL